MKYFKWNRDGWVEAWVLPGVPPVFDADRPYIRISARTLESLQPDGTWKAFVWPK